MSASVSTMALLVKDDWIRNPESVNYPLAGRPVQRATAVMFAIIVIPHPIAVLKNTAQNGAYMAPIQRFIPIIE
jgi:hypothetical protein